MQGLFRDSWTDKKALFLDFVCVIYPRPVITFVSISLIIQVFQTVICCQNITCRKLNKLHPKKQHQHFCGMPDTSPHVFKPIPVSVKWRQSSYSSSLMSLWSRYRLNVEHNLAHSRCSLSGDGCGFHAYGCVEGFPGESSRGFVQERSGRWSCQGFLCFPSHR